MSEPISRRNFLVGSAVAAAAAGIAITNPAQAQDQQTLPPVKSDPAHPRGGGFKMLYAPHFGMFENHAGKDLVDQLKFMADQGFRALEDNGLPKRSPEEQTRIGQTLTSLNMEMGVFVAHGDFGAQTFVKRDPAVTDMLKKEMEAAVEIAKRVNAKWCTIVLDAVDPKAVPEIQMANAIDNLRTCAEVLEKGNLIGVLEPLNRFNHPNLYLTSVPQSYALCRAVNSPSIKTLDDLYHAQIQVGNLIPDLETCWNEIAYYQVGDNPGRKEPGTGEINYRNIFKRLHDKGYKGIVGMEHGKAGEGKPGEIALIKAYQDADNF